MNEVKTTEFLAGIMEKAKKIGRQKNNSFTAERFFVALIDEFSKAEGVDITNSEAYTTKILISEKLESLENAKKALMDYIVQPNSTSFLDTLYMNKKLQDALKILRAADSNSDVDAVTLVMCILGDPSDAIKSIITGGEPEAEEGAALVVKLPDIDAINAAFEEEIKSASENSAPAEAPAADNSEANNGENGENKQENSEETKKAKPSIHDEVKAAFEKKQAASKEGLAALVADVKRIRTELQSLVYGQDNAVNVFTTGYFQANMRSATDKNRRQPRATFLFAGPPGVGKTFLAEKAAEALKLPFKRFDMSEYADKEASIEFCGADDVYKDSKPGNVTSFVDANPKCVLLFDEIEKAHLSVIHLFLQLLDAGRLRDNHTDKEVSFTDAIIILTTNAGRQLYEESESGDFSAVSRKVIVKALQKDINPLTNAPFFPAAICSRFASGNVVMFNHIGAHNLSAIAKKEIMRQAANFERETGIKLEFDERVYTALLFSEGSNADARTIKGRAETFFNDEVYELFRLIASEKVKTNIANVEKIHVDIDLSQSKPEIVDLFTPTNKTKVLLFAENDVVELCKRKTNNVDFVGVSDVKSALEVMKSQSIDFVLIDMKCGASSSALSSLNIEDADSSARDFFKILREQRQDIPPYILETRGLVLNEEERISFMRQGIRDVLRITRGRDSFAKQIDFIASSLHQQASMVKLAKANKLISFETAQSISKNGKNAEIKLFDFNMSVAVDSEDAKNVLNSVSKPDVRFDQVIGAADAKKELTYFVEYLKNPKKYMGTGLKAPKGVILYGPPGTGKTMLAKAMACEADVTFIAAEGNQFLKKYIGEGSDKVHELFRTARKYAPSILFIDEIDAIAKERKGGSSSTSNGEDTLTSFLTEMDGFINDPSKPVFVLAATNFDVEPGGDKSLDPALMRRFDRRIYIDLPDKNDRIKFLKMKIAKNKALQISEEKIDNISVRSTGMSLAELDSVIEFALRSAIRDGSTTVTDAIFDEAFETFNNGEVKKWDASQLERVARHEAGHAFLSWLSGDTPTYLTIVARGGHGGYMQHGDNEGKAIYTKDELLANIKTSLGGRAAEIVYYGERDGVSTGASGDLMNATSIATRIVCTYGMDDEFGLAVVHSIGAANGAMSLEIRDSVNKILKEQMDLAIRTISENKDKIDALVEELMQKNHMNGEEINQVLSSGKASALEK